MTRGDGRRSRSVGRGGVILAASLLFGALLPVTPTAADASAATAPAATAPAPPATRLLVTLRSRPRGVRASRATLPASAERLARAAGGTVGRAVVPGVFSVDVAADRVGEVTRLLEARPEVERVEPNRPVRAFTTPNDPCVTLCPFARPSQWALGKIGAFGAWDVTKGSADVLVAVVDSGVTTTNPDLGGKVVVGPAFAPAANATRCAGVFPEDHGTNVAGIIAAATDNAVGVAGLGWNTRVLSIKVLDNYGCGDEESVAKGIVYAADQPNVRVINLSLGVRCDGARPGSCPSETLGAAVRYAQDRNKLVVAAAGNGDGQHGLSTPVYPAAYPNALAVAATDRNDALWGKSNYGSWVDLAAPGVEITSTYQDSYGTFDGTSEAAPFVAATAALIVAAHPELGANEVAARILAHSDWIPGTGTTLAHGRLDTGGAVRNPPRGYWLAGLDGGVYTFGTAGFHGSAGGTPLAQPVIGIAGTPSGNGYWLVASDGGIFAFGDARFFGSTGAMRLNQPIVGMAGTPSGNGYWLVASDGGIFAFGDARFFGSTGAMRLNQPIVGMAGTPSGNGYWLVASDGGIFAFGDARFLGSTGAIRLARPIVGMAAAPSGNGYWMVARDGGMFAFGDAAFLGSTGGEPGLPIVTGMAATGTGQGYWLLRIDGSVAAFGDAPDLGRPAGPTGFVIGIAARH